MNRTVALVTIVILTAGAAWGQPEPVRMSNPVAGVSMVVPGDWEMGTCDWGGLFFGLDADASPGLFIDQAQILFYYCNQTPADYAKMLASLFKQFAHVTAQISGQGDKVEVRATMETGLGPMDTRWRCCRVKSINFVVAAFVPPRVRAQFEGDINRALDSVKLIAGPKSSRFKEPHENAYSILIPQGWNWSGNIVRTTLIPGYFEWMSHSRDGLAGVFSGKPATFGIDMPYRDAAECAKTFVLDGLRKINPTLRLESIEPQPRWDDYQATKVRVLKLGERPQIHKVRADYLGEADGVPVRLRATVATVMMDTSLILGGRGDWWMTVGGAWAPVDQWAKFFSLGRGVMASLVTDPVWKKNQFETASEVALDRWGLRDHVAHHFIVDYLKLRDHHDPPGPDGKPAPDDPAGDPAGGNGGGNGGNPAGGAGGN